MSDERNREDYMLREWCDLALCAAFAPPWGVVEDIKGDGHWDNEFHVLAEGGEGMHLATCAFYPHAYLLAALPGKLPALLGVAEALSDLIDLVAWDPGRPHAAMGTLGVCCTDGAAWPCPVARGRAALARFGLGGHR